MTQPTLFDDVTPRYAFPYLFPGQAQKEFYVNEAHALIDVLLQMAVEGASTAPPTAPADGECWLIDAVATGAWTGHDRQIGYFRGTDWAFVAPTEGMRIFDRSRRQFMLFDGAWVASSNFQPPAGGTTVDLEARQAIAELISLLRDHAILPPS